MRRSFGTLAAVWAIAASGALAPSANGFTFTPAPGSPYELQFCCASSVAVGDFNGDGKADVAVGQPFSGHLGPGPYHGLVSVLLADAGGGFNSPPGYGNAYGNALGTGEISVAAADFNGDGKLDLAATDSDGVWVLLGNGDGTFSPTLASPISEGHTPGQVVIGDFNGDGKPDLAALNRDDTVSVLLGNGDGTFTPAPGSPITVGNGSGDAIAVGDFSGDGRPDLAVLSGSAGPSGAGTLTVLLGAGDGSFTLAPGSPMSLNASPNSLVVADFNGDGKPDIAVAAGDGGVFLLLGRGDGSFTPAPGSPILVPGSALSGVVAGDFNSDGKPDIASAGWSDSRSGPEGAYLFLGDGNGRFQEAHGSPFPVSAPNAITTGPEALGSATIAGRTALIVDPRYYEEYGGKLDVLLAPLPSDPPTAALTVTPNQAVAGTPVSFDASASSDPLDRQIVDYRWDLGNGGFDHDTGATPTISSTYPAAGTYAVRVRITNSAGETAIASAQLIVRPHPPVNTRLPAISGIAKAGRTLACSTGAWTPVPSAVRYQWGRYGTPLVGATHGTYRVQRLDQGSPLTCTVIAANVAGSGLPATSKAVSVRVPRVKGCPAATGTASGSKLGLARLGMTRKRARRAYTHHSDRRQPYDDFFCMTPTGVRVGYPSLKLLGSARATKSLAGKVVWISTSNPRYAVDGIRPGATLTAAQANLRNGHLFHIGRNYWYLARVRAVTAIFKTRHGVVQEVGIANKRLTRTHKDQHSFLTTDFS